MLENNTARFVFLILGAIVLGIVVISLTNSWDSIEDGFNSFFRYKKQKM